jgi:hypothetical protein
VAEETEKERKRREAFAKRQEEAIAARAEILRALKDDPNYAETPRAAEVVKKSVVVVADADVEEG